MRVRKHVVVHGQVQGVGFRYAVAQTARTRGVDGWVRNNANGTVDAVLEGEPEAVESVVRFCERGPRGAHVARVETSEETPQQLSGFDVR